MKLPEEYSYYIFKFMLGAIRRAISGNRRGLRENLGKTVKFMTEEDE
jgi:hypothetical protein